MHACEESLEVHEHTVPFCLMYKCMYACMYACMYTSHHITHQYIYLQPAAQQRRSASIINNHPL